MKSPTLINIEGRNNMSGGPNEMLEIAANITVEFNAGDDTATSFSSLVETQRSMLGESTYDQISNITEEELEINNNVLKSLFTNILGRTDNIEIELKSLNNRVVAANKENEILKKKYELEVIKNKKLKATIEDTKDMIFDLDCRIIQNEQYSRRESVIISGYLIIYRIMI